MNTFKDIFTGGACNAGENQLNAQRNQNPFRNFMDQMFFGQAQNQQRLEGFVPNQPGATNVNQQILDRQLAYQNMNKEWDILSKEFDQKKGGFANPEELRALDEQWKMDQFQYEEMLKLQEFENQKAWESANAQYNAEQWVEELHMNEVYQNSQNEVERKIDPETEQQTIKKAAFDMIDVMKNDPDPKFKNSKFLEFLMKVNTGEYKIQNNELIVKDPQNVTQEEVLENIFQKAEAQYDPGMQEEIKMNEAWEESKNEPFKFQPQEDEEFEKMLDEQYKNILLEMEKSGDPNDAKYKDALAESWQKASDLEEQLLFKDISDVYKFSHENPFINAPKPLQIALDLMAQGRTGQAILAMEAHLQKNEKDAQTWRILGRLHQENDQDQKAVSCLLNAYKLEPENLDTLLALGISCTNILDEVKAMNFLSIWMQNNKNYQSLNLNTNLIPENRLYDDFKIEEIKAINTDMLTMFQRARELHPDDPELLTSLSVLHFIARDYENSVLLFKEALKYDTSNYSLWNKLGATLAHLGRAHEAIDAYHRALELKPNYVRVWVNLGIAHSYIGEYEEASRFYLNALSFNPDAKHVWNYLQTTFVCMQRFDLIPKIGKNDINEFTNEFEITRIEELPQPEIGYDFANNKYVIKEDVNKWINELTEEEKIN